jgi:hypothetical protein
MSNQFHQYFYVTVNTNTVEPHYNGLYYNGRRL